MKTKKMNKIVDTMYKEKNTEQKDKILLLLLVNYYNLILKDMYYNENFQQTKIYQSSYYSEYSHIHIKYVLFVKYYKVYIVKN